MSTSPGKSELSVQRVRDADTKPWAVPFWRETLLPMPHTAVSLRSASGGICILEKRTESLVCLLPAFEPRMTAVVQRAAPAGLGSGSLGDPVGMGLFIK